MSGYTSSSNFHLGSYTKKKSMGNPLAQPEVKDQIRRVLAAKGNTMGFPVNSLLPDDYVKTNKMGIDLDTLQKRRIVTRVWSGNLHSNHEMAFRQIFPYTPY